VQIEFDNPQMLHAIEQALAPEEKSAPTDRVVSSLERTDSTIRLQFNAVDLVSLRAAVNSYLRLITSIQNVLEVILNSNAS
jgi:tRNA threonylcarbamoyladenosine modification (KEOPS) complex  Pcc1 subunit